jgi:hypothetical protein
MRNFSEPKNIIGVVAPQHGSFMRITDEEYERLVKAFPIREMKNE